jgi:hypothetical protein
MINIFGISIIAAVAGLTGAYYYDGWHGLAIAAILSLLEISLSFDNAIVNASILKDMEPKWRRRFLTWGILIAVFGMRLVFPILLVAFATGLSSPAVIDLALNNPLQYQEHLLASHATIASFGGMFLLMVFLGFILNAHRKLFWLGKLEETLGKIGMLESMEVIMALLLLVGLQSFLPEAERHGVLIAGIAGISTYVIIHSLANFMNTYYKPIDPLVKRVGITSFLYLEVLDASFSFDGVIGAFAISNEIVIIMIGLGIGAFFVRSLTIFLVEKHTLQNYVFLEHGAHYALGVLALLMLISIKYKIPEIVIGTVGLVIILCSFKSSLTYLKEHKSKAVKI